MCSTFNSTIPGWYADNSCYSWPLHGTCLRSTVPIFCLDWCKLVCAYWKAIIEKIFVTHLYGFFQYKPNSCFWLLKNWLFSHSSKMCKLCAFFVFFLGGRDCCCCCCCCFGVRFLVIKFFYLINIKRLLSSWSKISIVIMQQIICEIWYFK